MNAYLALIRINMRLSMREKSVLFFNYFFPLVFFFGFGQFMGARAAGVGAQLISMVLVIGILGSGLFGAGMRTVMEREANILRRYKVTPISPLPLLVASVVVGWLLYMPSAALIVVLAHYVYGVVWPTSPLSLFVILSVGAWAFRALGLIIASVANSVAESNILVQLLYMPMLFISGVTIPLNILPDSVQIIAQFLPASYLATGIGRVLLRGDGVLTNIVPIAALAASTALSLFVAVKLFRWEKEERIGGGSKAWVAGVLLPFIGLGVWQAYSRDHIVATEVLNRELRRANPHLIHGGRVFVGDGRVIENATVLVENGKITAIFEGSEGPDADDIGATLIEAAGKTVLPGLIDLHVHLGSPGGAIEDPAEYDGRKAMDRALAAYLYSGVVAVRSAGDFTDAVLDLRRRVNGGEQLGAELFVVGPLFTAEGGHGAEFFENAPAVAKLMVGEQFIRTPNTAEEARAQVRALEAQGVDGIKAVLEAGVPGMLFQRLDLSVLGAIGEQAHADGLPFLVHTGDAQDVADATAAGASVVEHGSARNAISNEVFGEMKRHGVAYDPTLSVIEAFARLAVGDMTLLDRSLVQQAAPEGMIAATRKQFASAEGRKAIERLSKYPADLAVAGDNLARALRAGVLVVTGTDSGNPLLLHGPAVHHELQLWVAAGATPSEALQAATHNAAKALGLDGRIGLIQPGYEASLIVVDGNPLEEIAATERISAVIFKGERINRQNLFEDFE